MATALIRRIKTEDNAEVATIIRAVMGEFGAVGCGFSIEDAEVDWMCEAYPAPQSVFYVIEQDGKIVGCGGAGPLTGADAGTCELRKMYFLPELRGSGLGKKLLKQILDDARQIGYQLCYLETLDNMKGARHLYLSFGFDFIDDQLGATGHSGCNNYMTLKL